MYIHTCIGAVRLATAYAEGFLLRSALKPVLVCVFLCVFLRVYLYINDTGKLFLTYKLLRAPNTYVCSYVCSYTIMTQVPAKLFLTHKFLCVPMCVPMCAPMCVPMCVPICVLCVFLCVFLTGASEAIPHVQIPAGSKCPRLGFTKGKK